MKEYQTPVIAAGYKLRRKYTVIRIENDGVVCQKKSREVKLSFKEAEDLV